MHPKTNPKLVRTHSALFWCWDKPRATLDSLDSPWPGLGGGHHHPPYSILCIPLLHPHPNGLLSRDSQCGVPKLSRFRLPGLWELITLGSDLGLGWGTKQSCNSPWELSNGVLHYIFTHRGQVDSRLLVVRSQTISLTPDPYFVHNLCWGCPNGSSQAIFDIYVSIPFQQNIEHSNARCFGLCNWTLKFQESQRTPSPQLWECEFHPHTWSKWGCDKTNGTLVGR